MKLQNRLRWQQVKDSKRGQYVTFRGQRLYFDEFVSQSVEGFPIVGVIGTSYFSAYGIELSGEMARVYSLYW